VVQELDSGVTFKGFEHRWPTLQSAIQVIMEQKL
jgi:hypothetical protein